MARKNSRAASGSGSIRQRTDGTWEARYVVGADPATGKKIRRSVYGKTQKEVRQKLTAALRALDTGTYQTPSRITVSEWMSEWLEVFCTGVKPLTLESYQRITKNYISRIGAVQLQDLRASHVQRMINHMTAQGLSPKTIRNATSVFHKALSIALKQGMIQMNPCDIVSLPRTVKPQIKPLTDAEIPLFLQACDNHPFGNAYALCLLAGLREGECMGLAWEHVDFDAGRITVCQQLQRGGNGVAPITSQRQKAARCV